MTDRIPRSTLWALHGHAERGDAFVTVYEAPPEVEFGYSQGRPLGSVPPARLHYDPRRRLTDLVLGVHSFPVVSRRLREIIAATESHVEFLPVELVAEGTGAVDTTYSVINVLDNVAAVDLDASDVDVVPQTPEVILEFRHLVLRAGPLAGRQLVRLGELPSVLVAGAALKGQLEREGVTGLAFVDVDDLSSWD